MIDSIEKSVLVAIIKNRRDFEIARDAHWYRIPVKSAPDNVRKFVVKFLAFYQTKAFKEHAYRVEWFAKISRITVVRRKELFPDERNEPKRNEDYFKIELEPLQPLPKPIVSRRWRRIVFIETTLDQLMHAEEINDLFHESPIEERLWDLLRREGISAERQYFVCEGGNRYCLDFAIFCKKGKINVECDGGMHYTKRKHMSDTRRNNVLESAGWKVLRFPGSDILTSATSILRMLKKNIKDLGGLEQKPASVSRAPSPKWHSVQN